MVNSREFSEAIIQINKAFDKIHKDLEELRSELALLKGHSTSKNNNKKT